VPEKYRPMEQADTERTCAHAGVRWAILVWLLASGILLRAQYAAGDHGAWVSGNWNVVGTWRVYDGMDWATSPAAAAIPTAASNVHILAGRTVNLSTSPNTVNSLTVEAGAKLWTTNSATNRYLTVHGPVLRCDGTIGDGANFDGISFNFNGVATAITGTGFFDCSRLRKYKGFGGAGVHSATTALTIGMDVNVNFETNSATGIYNNEGAGPTLFNMTILPGAVLTLRGAGNGNVSIDGIGTNGMSGDQRGGTYRVEGTLIVPGTLFLWNNNTSNAHPCSLVVASGGRATVGTISTGADAASGSGTAGQWTIIEDGGTLELTGTGAAQPWRELVTGAGSNNSYLFGAASTTVYAGSGGQEVRQIIAPVAANNGYGHLVIRGTGVKAMQQSITIRGNLDIRDTDGTPVLDVLANARIPTLWGDWTSYSEAGFNERAGTVNFAQGALQRVQTAGGERFHNWQIAKLTTGPRVVMDSEVTVANELRLNTGILELNGRTLEVLSGATTAIRSTAAFGPLRHIRSESTDNSSRVRWHIGMAAGAHVFPFGTAGAGNYRPFIFTPTVGDAGIVTVATYGTGPDNLPWPVSPDPVTNLASYVGLLPDNRDATVDRFWQVDVTGTPTATITFSYAASELPASPWDTPTLMRAQRWDNTTQQWMPPPEAQTANAYSVTVSDVTVFSPWTLAPVVFPLPITLLSFDALPRQRSVDIIWSTASEQDNAFFTVLRSADGVDFHELMRLPGAGDSQQRIDYHAVDDGPLPGLSYYRLRQNDDDGTSTESRTVAVHFGGASNARLFPNPAGERVMLDGLDASPARLRVLDMLGRPVLLATKPGDTERMVLELPGLATGRYLVVVEGTHGSVALPLVKE